MVSDSKVVVYGLGLNQILDHTVLTDAIRNFIIWDQDWNPSPTFNAPPFDDLPTSAVRVPQIQLQLQLQLQLLQLQLQLLQQQQLLLLPQQLLLLQQLLLQQLLLLLLLPMELTARSERTSDQTIRSSTLG